MKRMKKVLSLKKFYEKRPSQDFKFENVLVDDPVEVIERIPKYIEQFVYIMSHPNSGKKDILYLNKLLEPLTWDQNHLDKAMLGPDLVEKLEERLSSRKFFKTVEDLMSKMKATYPISTEIPEHIKKEKKKLEDFVNNHPDLQSKVKGHPNANITFDFDQECQYFYHSKIMGNPAIKKIMMSKGNALQKAYYLVLFA